MNKTSMLLLLGLTSLLSACGTPTPVPVEPKPVLSISGNASAAAGKSLILMGSDGLAVSKETNVAADGSFTVALPDPEESRRKAVTNTLSGIGCEVTQAITSSDPAAKGLGISKAKPATGEMLMPATVSRTTLSRTIELHSWIYSDRATTLKGELNCAKALGGVVSSLPVTVDTKVAAGWTPVVASIKVSVGLSGINGSGSVMTANDFQGSWLTSTELGNQVKP